MWVCESARHHEALTLSEEVCGDSAWLQPLDCLDAATKTADVLQSSRGTVAAIGRLGVERCGSTLARGRCSMLVALLKK